ncbi:cryptococcal mannosyltransferase 1-domain-containing protein [Trametes elegans]|nr:cryptococcal mannosyltransferase 1-domain-containing protein [Trametes elegans]
MRYDTNADDVRRAGGRALAQGALIVRLLGRAVLVVVRIPLVLSLFCFLLAYAHIVLYLGGVWQPGFPRAFTAWVAFLIAIPVWAAVRFLSVLVAHGLAKRCAYRFRPPSREQEGYMMLNTRGSEEDGPPPPPPPRSRLPTAAAAWCAFQLVLYASLILPGLYHLRHYESPSDIRLRPALQRALAATTPNPAGYAPVKERIFIAAAFHQNEDVLPYWTRSIRQAIVYLGTANVFVSVVENYSTDRSPELLRAFARELDALHVPHRILVSDETVPRPPQLEWNARIEFLAAIRNQALEPLVHSGGYDRVLFSNDIYIEPESVLELLATRDGDYDFACGLDFGHFGAYDMWVLRDRAGRLTAAYWPYFLDPASLGAVKRGAPAPVYACWNGLVAFRADPVLPVALRSNRTLSPAPLPTPPPPGNPYRAAVGPSPALTPPLRFRASAPGECYSSESFLLPHDFRRVMGLEGVYANPAVASAYVWRYYVWHKWVLRAPPVRWFVERVWDGAWMQYARMVVGDPEQVWVWDGVECHPWWAH